jgi:hypothetical protein
MILPHSVACWWGWATRSSSGWSTKRPTSGMRVRANCHPSTPADLPVEQPTKFEVVINLKTPRRSDWNIEATHRAAAFVDKILKGARPSELRATPARWSAR